MKSLGELRTEKELKIDKLMSDSSMFFAFSDEQFEKNKTPKPYRDVYVTIGGGCYLPKSKGAFYLTGMRNITRDFETALSQNNLRKQQILYELNNHECFYTGEIEAAQTALGSEYSIEEIMEVYITHLAQVE